MEQVFLPYGKTKQALAVPESIQFDLILPNPVAPALNPKAVVRSALDSADGFSPELLKSARRVAIAINDKTRPVPHAEILPPLLHWLAENGVESGRIQFWIATGSHKPMPADEYRRVLPEDIIRQFSVRSHDIDDISNLIELGVTSRGTPIIVNRAYYEADVKIVVGDIEPHHFAGFSGGYKTASIGLAGRATINHNHAMIVDPNAWIGEFERNPLRQDIEEIGQVIGVHLALNTILTTDKKIVAAVSGHPARVITRGIPISASICGTKCNQRYDVVVASAGGSPKDINFYQAQKALTHASLFARPGGALILAAQCPEGSGSLLYEEFMGGVTSVSEALEKFSQMEFRVGPHKAYQVARLLGQYQIYLVSDIPEDLVTRLLMTPSGSVQEAFDAVLVKQELLSSVAVLPHATTTIPFEDKDVNG